MKNKLYLSILIISLFFDLTLAQTNFNLGLKTGVNFANLSFDPDLPSALKKSGRTLLNFGVLSELSFNDIFSSRIETLFLQGGTKLSAYGSEYNIKLSYIAMPILLKVNIPTGSIVVPYAFTGPNLAFIISAKGEADGEVTDIKNEFTSINFGIDMGAGLSFRIAPSIKIIFDARYSLGFTDIFNNTGKQDWYEGTGIEDQKLRSNNFILAAGVLINL